MVVGRERRRGESVRERDKGEGERERGGGDEKG